MTVRYDVSHETEYVYSSAVSISRQALHLTPRALLWQQCLRHELHIEPAETFRREETDSFGNPLIRLEIDTPHRALLIAAAMVVEVSMRACPASDGTTKTWQETAAQLCYAAGHAPAPELIDAIRFRCASPFVPYLQELRAYALADFSPGASTIDAAHALMQRIHRDFRYDAEATHIATPLAEVFKRRRGVCQDFAHLMIGCLRALGLSARYISGYLVTSPPADKPRLIGADASHAWVSVWCAERGWVDFDPTNDTQPQLSHVTLAWGRDFGDVSPLRGIILGGGEHDLSVRVTVTPQS